MLTDHLLADVPEPHGGLGDWRPTTPVTARLVPGGAFWAGRGWPEAYIVAATSEAPDEHIERASAEHVSASSWRLLTAPLVFAGPGAGAHALPPWEEDGETSRRLALLFPPFNAADNADEVFYYDADLLLRCMDCSPDVCRRPPVAHHEDDPVAFDGFVFPTRRPARCLWVR
jgi:hypothetical protein